MTPQPDIIAAARAAQSKWGVPASVSIAQYALESGWGAHCPGNNPFGIKAMPAYGVQRLMTTEVIHGHAVKIPQDFCAFASINDAFDCHAKLLANAPVYAAAMRAKTVDAFVAAMAPHYATDPQYAAKIMAIINGSKLTQYDRPMS